MQKTNNDVEPSFFKKVIMSIKDFDKYTQLASKRNSQVFLYLLKLMAIFTVLVSLLSVYTMYKQIKNTISYVNEEIPNFTFENNILSMDSKEKIQIKHDDIAINNIIINTSEVSDEEIEKYKAEIEKSNNGNGIIVLQDKILLKTNAINSGIIEYTYEDISNNYNIEKIDKQTLINYFSGNNLIIILIGIFIIIYIYLLIIYMISVLIDAMVLSIIGYVTALILRLKLRISAMLKIAIHSLTLPIILNLIYITVQTFTGFEMKYFNIMYIGVAYVYMITCILMIKSDIIKKQQELAKIIEEQEKVKEEIEENEKQKEKKKEEENKDENKEKNKKKNKKDKDNNETQEPQGENA